MRRSVSDGENPQEKRRTAGERTFAKLAQRYLDEYARRHKKSAAIDELMFAKHILPYWGRRDFVKIRRADVIELCERIVSAGHSPIRRSFRCVRPLRSPGQAGMTGCRVQLARFQFLLTDKLAFVLGHSVRPA